MHGRLAVLSLIALATFAAAPADAQDTIPRWGVEATTGGATSGGGLLRFRNPSSAWVLQSTLFYDRFDESDADAEDIISFDARLGMRFYRRVTTDTRPFTTISGVFTYQHSPGTNSARPGLALEAGVSHFFSRRVSLGVSSDVRALYSRDRVGGFGGNSVVRNRLSVYFGGFRLVGGVYF